MHIKIVLISALSAFVAASPSSAQFQGVGVELATGPNGKPVPNIIPIQINELVDTRAAPAASVKVSSSGARGIKPSQVNCRSYLDRNGRKPIGDFFSNTKIVDLDNGTIADIGFFLGHVVS